MNKKHLFLGFFVISFSVYSAEKSASAPVAESMILNKSEVTITAASCESDSPCRVVSDTSKKVLEAVNRGVPQNQTITLINNVAAPQFDFTLMTKYALGNNWKLANPEQQQQLVELFKQLLIYTYSTALSKFKGAQINITSSSIDGKKAEVMSQVLMPAVNPSNPNQPIKVEYDLAKPSGAAGWKAYDIKIENASLVTTYRNQFNDVVQSSKIEGLIKQLQTKVASLKEKNS
ncbi:MAG: phospholipid transport system substrate-binding protein [Pseudomonadota bacterium]|nr:phospholipid transport system substrate-binding protein [Pseudomonadota bacterium]